MSKDEPAPDRSDPWSDSEGADHEITRTLRALNSGDPGAAASLVPLVYDELRGIAARRLAKEAPGQTLQATALVHEAYIRLLAPNDQTWANRRHFFVAVAEAMRRILIDNARRKRAIKRGGEMERSAIDLEKIPFKPPSVDTLDLNEAIDELERVDLEAAELVKLRYFAGLTMEQIAEVQGVSRRTTTKLWAFARTWLYKELTGSG
jgi:RNA polymerase sigma factor (TIGR02999 family)